MTARAKIAEVTPRRFRHALLGADERLFSALARSRSPVLDRTLPALSQAANLSRLWIACAALLALVGGPPGKRAARSGLISLGITSAIVNLVLKPLFRRRRPSLRSVPSVRRLRRQPRTAAFPSGHAASAAAFATGASLELPAAAPPLAALAGAVALSRIYTGVHHPSDVAAGLAVGAGIAVAGRASRGRRWRSGAASPRHQPPAAS
jgi:membrane-associated phospholipid phosphatase